MSTPSLALQTVTSVVSNSLQSHGLQPARLQYSRQEYWSVLSCPPPGDLPDPGIEPTPLMSPALAGRFFTTSANWEAPLNTLGVFKYQLREALTLCHL